MVWEKEPFIPIDCYLLIYNWMELVNVHRIFALNSKKKYCCFSDSFVVDSNCSDVPTDSNAKYTP